MINKICIIGVGLIGGSLALALKKANYCRQIVGLGRCEQRLQAAQQANIIDSYTTDYAAGIAQANIVFISVPLDAYQIVFKKIANSIPADAVVTDAGSAKACVIEDAKEVFGSVPQYFVPGHPIAGTEKSGHEAALIDLYKNRKVILTPLVNTDPKSVELITEMWEAAGAVVETAEVEHHDRVLAATSHLPHLLAFGLVDSLAKQEDVEEIFRFAAGGFRDFTRIAAADPVMWRDICLRNRQAILDILNNYQADLGILRNAVEQSDGDTLMDIFQNAKQARDKFSY